MKKRTGVSRRNFLKIAAGAAAFPMVVPASALGFDGTVAPSNRIVMGCIGMGGMGNADMGAFLSQKDCQVVAVCDVDASHRLPAQQRVNNYYASRGGRGTYKGCAAYEDFRELLARDDIDAVQITTPDHWHAIIAVAAAKAGKDMYCEKPLSLTIREGRIMSDTVRRYERVFQVGSQQRSDHNFRFACELVRNKRIGDLKTIRVGFGGSPSTGVEKPMPIPKGFNYDMWLGQAPWAPYTKKRCHFTFRWILDYSGGMMTDWGAHHNDIAQWGNGTEYSGPIEIEGHGIFPKDGLWNTATSFHVKYTYANGVVSYCDSAYPNGIKFEGTEGWVFVTRGRIDAHPKSLLSSTIRPNEIHLYKSPGHHRNFLDCVKTRRETVAPVEVAHRSVTVCHLGNISMLLGRKLRWDPDRECFIGDPEADRMRMRAKRDPWRV